MNNAKVFLTVPQSWQELTDAQLYYVYNLFADSLSMPQIKSYCFFAFSRVKIRCRYGDGYLARFGKQEFYLSPDVVASALHALDYLDSGFLYIEFMQPTGFSIAQCSMFVFVNSIKNLIASSFIFLLPKW